MNGIVPVLKRLTAALTLLACASASATAASSGTIVSATIPSATTIDATACTSGAATSFGIVQPGSTAVTSSNCTVSFGSSNDSSRLRLRQTDSGGSAMYLPTDGTLDPGYGTSGSRTESTFTGKAFDAILQPDGKLVVVGISNGRFAVVRYTTSGTIDPGFNGGAASFYDRTPCNDEFGAVALQPDGKIIAVGHSYYQNPFAACDPAFSSNYSDIVVRRYNTNGTPDNTFGTSSVRVINFDLVDTSFGVAVQPDGQIVLAASAGPIFGRDGVAVRIAADGSSHQYITIPMAPNGWFDYLNRVAIADDGSILLAGAADRIGTGTSYDTAIAKLKPDFTLDPTFGGGPGYKVFDIGGNDGALGLALQPDGKLIVAGLASGDAAITRFNANGSTRDATFGTGGTTLLNLGSSDDAATRMTIEGDGRIVATGGTHWNDSGGGPASDVAIMRLRPDGSPDTTFGGDGIRLFDPSGGSSDLGLGISPVLDGTIMVSGVSNGRFYTTRMAGVPINNYASGSSDWTNGADFFAACISQVTGATASWTTSLNCPSGNGLHWNPVATSATSLAYTAGASTGNTVSMRFGVKFAASQRPGAYIAPVTFEVIAPA